ncbi:MAG: hypothetical protein ACYC7E_02590 [Armatimonadota bacterium]
MTLILEVDVPTGRSALLLTPVDRSVLRRHRRVALDAQGRVCRTAWRTWDGVSVLPGALADGYEDPDGATVSRGEVVATDVQGRPLRQWPATAGRPQRLEGPVPPDDLLAHAVTKVYAVTAHHLDLALRQSLGQGDIYRVAFRPRPSTSDPPAFLLANAHGIFLLPAAPCRLDWLTREQRVPVDLLADEEDDTPAWGDWLIEYAEMGQEVEA